MTVVRRRRKLDLIDELMANLTAGHTLPPVRPARTDAQRTHAITKTLHRRERRLREVAAGGWRA